MMHICQHNEVVQAAFGLRAMLAMYVDPGSGSYYFQMLIAGLTTFCFFFSTIKRKIVSCFKKDTPAVAARETSPAESKVKSVAK
jgi:hypothetical protein